MVEIFLLLAIMLTILPGMFSGIGMILEKGSLGRRRSFRASIGLSVLIISGVVIYIFNGAHHPHGPGAIGYLIAFIVYFPIANGLAFGVIFTLSVIYKKIVS